MSAKTVIQQLASVLLTLTYDDLPQAVIGKGKILIADMLLVAAAGRAEESSIALRSAVAPSLGQSRVWFDEEDAPRYSAVDATFINTLHAAALDYDSLNRAVHADLVTLPAAWAVAEYSKTSPRAFFTAWIAATEAVSRLSRCATGPSKGWSGTSIYGGIGAALASGLLLGLNASQLAHAAGLAAVQAAGTQQANIEHTLAKRLQPALAARDGVFAAFLAKAGATAPAQALEGKFGLRALYQPGDDSPLLQTWGKEWQFADTALKRFPICACSHAAVQALLTVKDRLKETSGDVVEIVAEISPFMHRLVGDAFESKGNPEVIAQFNLRYHLASAFLRGPVTLEHIQPEALEEEAVKAWVARVRVVIDTNNQHELAPATVRVVLKDGKTLSSTCHYLPGSPEMPPSYEDRLAKARACAAYARPALDEHHLEQLLQQTDRLPDLTQLDQVWRIDERI